MKLSFKQSSSSKPKPKPKPEPENPSQKPEFLTEFDPSKTPNNPTSKPLIIPPIQNQWQPSKRMKNLHLPPLHSAGKPLEFEPETQDLGPGVRPDPGPDISYGLNVRPQGDGSGEGKAKGSSIDAIMVKRLRSDLERLSGGGDEGEGEGFGGYDEVPVEGFAEALMAGYGWKKGMGIGRNAKEDTKVVEYKRWSAKEGIGFTLDSGGLPDGKAKEKAKEKANEENGGSGSVRFGVGKEVRVVGGREIGVKGRVVEVLPGGESIVLKLTRGEGEVEVRVDEVAELGSLEEERCLKKLKELRIRGSKDDKRESGNANGSGRNGNDSYSRRKESKRGRNEGCSGSGSRSGEVSWLRSHIRVRIISKSFKGGRFYLKKGEVLDVVGPTTCDISMDDGREFVQGVEQDILETALPRRGGPVLILFGKHKGVYGSLVEKDTEREAGVVQDADSRELFKVRLEQIAEYVGDPSDIGY